MIFKTLSQEEYDSLTYDERMAYLHRLMADIRQRLDDNRKQHDELKRKLPKL